MRPLLLLMCLDDGAHRGGPHRGPSLHVNRASPVAGSGRPTALSTLLLPFVVASPTSAVQRVRSFAATA